MARAAPALARHQAWRSVYGIVARFVRNEKLRQALSFHTLLVGGNPFTTSAIHALAHKRERDGGVRSEEHTSELQSLMRISYAVFCLKKKKHTNNRYIID